MNRVKLAAAYTAGAYLVDVVLRREIAAREARAYADSVNKPMLNVGAGAPGTALFGSTLYGDVNMDLGAPRVPCRPGVICHGDAHKLPFEDREFGSLLASHVLEHLDRPDRALAEWQRVADRLWVITPSWWAPHTWLHPGHRWYFAGDGSKLALWK